jgi:hypothetical protein
MLIIQGLHSKSAVIARYKINRRNSDIHTKREVATDVGLKLKSFLLL